MILFSRNQVIIVAFVGKRDLLERSGINQEVINKELGCPTQALQQETQRERIRANVNVTSKAATTVPPAMDDDTPGGKKTVKINNSPLVKFKSGSEDKSGYEVVSVTVSEPHQPESPEDLPSAPYFKEVALKVMLCIENSQLADNKKDEARRLFDDISFELQQSPTDWNRVISLLKKGFDYGIKIGAELAKVAEIYYDAKVLA